MDARRIFKTTVFLSFLLMAVIVWLMISGCAVMPRQSSAVPGSVMFINESEGAYGHAVVFEGTWAREDLFALNPQTGRLKWAMPSLGTFKIKSAAARDFHAAPWLAFTPNMDYTAYILWTRFNGRELDETLIHFRAYVDPRRRCHVDQLGIRTCASEIIYLSRINTSVTGPLRIHKTLYPGDWIKALFGIP